MNNKGAEPIQVVGVIVLVVLVVIALAVFFFSGLSQQGGVLAESSTTITSNLSEQINQSLVINISG